MPKPSYKHGKEQICKTCPWYATLEWAFLDKEHRECILSFLEYLQWKEEENGSKE